MLKLFYCALGGAIGSILRYSISSWVGRLVSSGFPWGTLTINLSGSFIIGLLWGIFEMVSVSANARIFILMGILGAFTTFSTFALENLQLLRSGETGMAILNIVLSNVIGLALVFLGYFLSRFIVQV